MTLPLGKPHSILIVEDERIVALDLEQMLTGMGYDVCGTASSAEEAIARATERRPDLVLMDIRIKGARDGIETAQLLRTTFGVPAVYLTAHADDATLERASKTEPIGYLIKPVKSADLRSVIEVALYRHALEVSRQELAALEAQNRALEEATRIEHQLRITQLMNELKHIATIDPLTDVANRRSFDETLERERKRSLRAGSAISLLMVDVDHFKLFNDLYGHPAGDVCLVSIARTLRNACKRPADLAARYGGEEFVLLLPQTSRAGAEYVAGSVLDAVVSLGLPHAASPTSPTVTVSIGLGCYDEASACWVEPSLASRLGSVVSWSSGDLVQSADAALYCAKRAGRGQAWRLDIADVQSLDPSRIARRCDRSERACN